MLTLVSKGLQQAGDIRVVATAKDVNEARAMIKHHNPDVITLDVEMPGMNGIQFLKKIMELRPTPVVMVSTLTAAGTDVTLTALEIGAVDALAKPSGEDAVNQFGASLRSKVRQAATAKVGQRPQSIAEMNRAASAAAQVQSRVPMATRYKLIAIGASTGGVAALTVLLRDLPPNGPPIVVTQHMPAEFTNRFANRLNQQLPHHVCEARTGEALKPGMIRIAPGSAHLAVTRRSGQLTSMLDTSGPVSGHKPSVDVLFNSAVSATGKSTVAAILTGMGRDGAAGMRALRNSGAVCFGQSEQTCVVYGMPKAARALDAVDEELDLQLMGGRIGAFLNGSALGKTG